MIVYIAGRITGDQNYREKFANAQKELEQAGHIVLNPACLPVGMKQADYMRICMAMLETAGAVALLPDWSLSRGAKLEVSWCRYTKKKTYALKELTTEK